MHGMPRTGRSRHNRDVADIVATAWRARAARPVRAALVCAAGLISAACSSASSTTATSTAAPMPATPAVTPTATAATGPTLSGTVATRGDYWITSAFTAPGEMETNGDPTPAPPAATCRDYAGGLGGAGTFAAPEVHTTAGSNPLFVRTTIDSGYTGPGTYTSTRNPSLTGIASVTLNVGGSTAYTLYNSKKAGGTVTLTVQADGSGSVSFADWGSDETRQGISGGSLDGTIQWSCS